MRLDSFMCEVSALLPLLPHDPIQIVRWRSKRVLSPHVRPVDDARRPQRSAEPAAEHLSILSQGLLLLFDTLGISLL